MRAGKTVAVMQPYFFPYAGYYGLLANVDEFVIFDCVQFRRRGRIHRAEVPGASGALEWLTLPMAYSPMDTTIRDMRFAEGAREEFDARLRAFPWIAEARGADADAVRAYLAEPLDDLVGYLERGLRLAARMLDVQPKISRSTDYALAPDLRGADRVLAAAVAAGATRYVNLPGGRQLYDAASFAAAGVQLAFLPDYKGPHLSMLHSFMTHDNCSLRAEIARMAPQPAS